MRSQLSEEKLGVVAHACHHSKGRKHKIEGLWSRPSWTKGKDPMSKITRAEKAAEVA
jgi:hypothetical protein